MNVKELKQAVKSARLTPLGIWEDEAEVVGLLLGGSREGCLSLRVVVRSDRHSSAKRPPNPYKVKFIAYDYRQSLTTLLQRLQTSDSLSALLLDEQALMALKPGRSLSVETAIKHLDGNVEKFRLIKEENDPARSNPDAA